MSERLDPEELIGQWLRRHDGRLGRYRALETPRPAEVFQELESAISLLNVATEELRTRRERIHAAAVQRDGERAHSAALFDGARDACIITDGDGLVRRANEAAALLCGMAQSSLVGMPLSAVVAERDRGGIHAALARLSRLESVRDFDVRIQPAAGDGRPVSAHGAVLPDSDAGNLEIRWLLRDAQEAARGDGAPQLGSFGRSALRKARHAEQRAHFLARAARALLDADGVAETVQRIVELAVPALGTYAMLDIVRPPVIERAAIQHVDPAAADVLRRTIGARIEAEDSRGVHHVLAEKRSSVIDRPPEGPPGACLPCGIELLIPLLVKDEAVGVLTVGRGAQDADEMNPLTLAESFSDLAAAALRQALALDAATAARRDAERANADKLQFLSVLSHEIRTPLSSALGYVELMLAGIPTPVPADHRPYADGIHASIRHQLGIVDQILQFAHIEPRTRSARMDPVDLRDILRDVADIVRPAVRDGGLELEVEVSEGVTISTDEGMLRQALVNIANNAARFTSAGRIRLTAMCTGDALVVGIRDTGPGIPAEHIDRVFEAFWRGPDSAARSPGGMGLGLSITHELVTALGGTIEVSSVPGDGSEFRVVLPIVRTEGPRGSAERRPS